MKAKAVTREGKVQLHTLGSLQLRHHETNEIILIPTPSNDPNDPLNWSNGYRYYLAGLVCLAMFFCNFLAAGPTVAIVQITIDYMGPPGPDFAAHIAKIAYFFTTTALTQGLSMLLWMPIILKYGRRPVYIISFTLYFGATLWVAFSKSYGAELAGRVMMGFATGAGECLAPLTIADIFFLHERGTIMAMYTAALSIGVGGGIAISGLITINLHWRYIYYIAAALIGAVVLLVFFTFPETTFNRLAAIEAEQSTKEAGNETDSHRSSKLNVVEHAEEIAEADEAQKPQKASYAHSLRIFTGTYTHEPLWKLFLRPVTLIILPPVLWAALVMSVTIGFLVAITSNFASAFSTVYKFEAWQSGLCFICAIIGSLIGIAFGGQISDWTADWFTKRNGGIREPEMRLPSMLIGGVFAPLALVLYGVGINNQLHWMVPTLGLGMLNFAIVQVTNVSLVYTIDAYRPAAGEVTVSQLAFKALFGFLLSFYTNPWIAQQGYSKAFGSMAGISAAVILLVIPMYFFGKKVRHATWRWTVIKKFAHWDNDREVGE